MSGKVVVVTGASDGIGAAAARQLHAAGHRVVVVGRSPAKTRAVAEGLGVASYLADFSRLDEVRRLAEELRRDLPRIDVLANNAGGIFSERQLTVDGHELTMQVNHLAPFLLTNLLLDRLLESRASVIATSSLAHRIFASFDIEDLDGAEKHSPRSAYGNAKLENILFTKELDRRFGAEGLSAAAFHPGGVATNFANDSGSLMRLVYGTPLGRLFLISADKGADSLVWLASTSPGEDWRSGEYYEKRKPAKTSSLAQDPELASQLWERSAAMCGL